MESQKEKKCLKKLCENPNREHCVTRDRRMETLFEYPKFLNWSTKLMYVMRNWSEMIGTHQHHDRHFEEHHQDQMMASHQHYYHHCQMK